MGTENHLHTRGPAGSNKKKHDIVGTETERNLGARKDKSLQRDSVSFFTAGVARFVTSVGDGGTTLTAGKKPKRTSGEPPSGLEKG